MPRTTIFRSKLITTVLILSAAVGSLSMAAAQTNPKTYTVKRGDTLMSIARSLLGDASRWREIFDSNSDKLSDPSKIYPGQVLRLEAKADSSQLAQVRPPHRTPERPEVVIEEPKQEQRQEQDPTDSTFKRHRGINTEDALRSYRQQPYKPLRRGEFHSAGFLTEGEALPLGTLLSSVSPNQIQTITNNTTITLSTTVAMSPPAGARYSVGDSLLIVQLFPGPEGYGDVVYPTGMLRVTGQNGEQTLGTVIALYGPVRNGQRVLPAERFVEGGSGRATPVENGVTGALLGPREHRELRLPQSVLFINLGKKDGVARGDVFEVRRDVKERAGASDTIDEVMAIVQVVHVREKSATVKVLNVVYPSIPPHSRVKQVGKLPS